MAVSGARQASLAQGWRRGCGVVAPGRAEEDADILGLAGLANYCAVHDCMIVAPS